MTTTPTCSTCNGHPATAYVTAQYLDPDPDDHGSMIGWSRSITSALCADCLEDEQNDSEYVAISEINEI
jgi:hypothetical protein